MVSEKTFKKVGKRRSVKNCKNNKKEKICRIKQNTKRSVENDGRYKHKMIVDEKMLEVLYLKQK